MNSMVNDFGKRIRFFLHTEKISDKAFANALGRTGGIGYYERNPGKLPLLSMILSIRKVYPNWSLNYILFGVGEPYQKETTPPISSYTKGHFANTAHWLAFREDIQRDLQHLPLEGFKPLVAHVDKILDDLGRENQDLFAQLEGILNQAPMT